MRSGAWVTKCSPRTIADATERDRIVAFWSQPRAAVQFIPKPPWRADWRTSSDPPALVFAIHQPADAWTIAGLGSVSGEAGFLAKAPWSELRPLHHHSDPRSFAQADERI